MTLVHLTYNPYLVKSSLVIDGADTRDGELFNLISNKRLDMWVEQIIPNLAKRINEPKFTIIFNGIKQDFEDLKTEAQRFNTLETGKSVTIEAIPGMEKNTPENKLMELRTLVKSAENAPIKGLADTEALSTFKQTLDAAEFEVFVVATMSSGKSTLINAFLGRDLLPAANQATTAAITRITDDQLTDDFYGNAYDTNNAPLSAKDSVVDINKMTEWNNNASKVHIRGPIAMNNGHEGTESLRLVLVDTPGPNNSNGTEHRLITYSAMDEQTPPLILYIIDCTKDLVNDNKTLLNDIASQMKRGGKRVRDRFLFVANRIDEIDPANESIGESLTRFASSLEDNGIENPRIFPVCSLLPKLIRSSRAGDEITRDESRKLRGLKEAFAEDEERQLLQYITPPISNGRVPVSNSVAQKVRQYIASAHGSNDELAIAHSGIITLEETIKEYITKYGLTEKINRANEMLNVAINIDTARQKICKNIESNTNNLNKISEDLKLIDEKLKRKDDADIFKKKLANMSFTNTKSYKITLNKIRSEYYSEINETASQIPQKVVHEDEGKHIIDIVCNNGKKAIEKLHDNFADSLNRVVKDQAGSICREYIDYYKAIIGETPEAFDIIDKLEFQLSAKMPELMRNAQYYSATIREEVGKREISDSVWYKPWTWFSSHYTTVHEDKPGIDMKQIGMDIQSRMTAHFEKTQDDLEKDITNRVCHLANEISAHMDKFDKEALKLIAERQHTVSSETILKHELQSNEEKLQWVVNFSRHCSNVLEL